MSGNMSRNKGQRGEREVIKLLQPIIDKAYKECGIEAAVLERNLMQSNKGGFDIVGLEWLALEVKFQEAEKLNDWWQQCVTQASRPVDNGDGTKVWKRVKEPVLIYRKSRAAWNVMMLGNLEMPDGGVKLKTPVIVSLETFKVWLYHRILNGLRSSMTEAGI
jgi:hypothetical protein